MNIFQHLLLLSLPCDIQLNNNVTVTQYTNVITPQPLVPTFAAHEHQLL